MSTSLPPYVAIRLRQRRPPLVLLTSVTLLGPLLTGATLPLQLGPDGNPPVRLLILWCAAITTAVVACVPRVQPALEASAAVALPMWDLLWIVVVTSLPVVLTATASVLGWTGEAGLVVRDVLGLVGVGLAFHALLGPVGIVLPWIYAFAAQLFGFTPQPGHPPIVASWAWLAGPVGDPGSWVWALSLLAVGIAVHSVSGSLKRA